MFWFIVPNILMVSILHLIFLDNYQLKGSHKYLKATNLHANKRFPQFSKKNAIIIASTGRSGSSFLYDLIGAHPGVYNVFEPLIVYNESLFYQSEPVTYSVTNLVHNILKCQYEDDYLKYIQSHPLRGPALFRNNKYMFCKKQNLTTCYDRSFIESVCRKYSWRGVKLIRLGFKFLKPILEDEALNTHVLFLVRDPRGVMNSRDKLGHCKASSTNCNNVTALCKNQEEDLRYAVEYSAVFPGRIHFIRYEDLCLSSLAVAKQLFRAVGLNFDESVFQFIKTHTTRNIKNETPFTTVKNSSNTVFNWVKEIDPTLLLQVQETCEAHMKQLGYQMLETKLNFSSHRILQPFTYKI